MELNELIKSRAHRILKKIDGYKSLLDYDTNTIDNHEFLLQKEEELLGIYQNNDDNMTEMIVITTAGLHIFVIEWVFVGYKLISDLSIPLNHEKDKTLVDRILARLQNGDTVEIPVKGGHGRMRDAWEFLRFLQRVRNDVHKHQT